MDTAKFIQTDQARLAYVESGDGEAVLFVHGAFSDHRFWTHQLSDLSSSHRCIAVDQRYCGQSWVSPVDNYSLITHASDLAAFVDQVFTRPVHVVASSYGSAVALAWAAARPRLCASLFLNEPALPSLVTRAEDLVTLKRARADLAPVVEALTAGDAIRAVELFCDWTSFPGGFKTLPPEVQAMFAENARTITPALTAPQPTVQPKDLASINVPVTFTAGDRTTPFFSVQVHAAVRAIRHARLVQIPNSHHAAPFENPVAFNRALRDHLRAAAEA